MVFPGAFLDLEKSDDGNLRIVLNDGGKAAWHAIDETRARFGIDEALRSLLDDHLQNGWEELRPEEIGALTSSMLLTDSAERDDEHRLVSVDRVYWNPRYQVDDEIEELRQRGHVLFHGAE